MEKTYKIEVDCPSCALKMEAAAAATPGVMSAGINFLTQKLKIEFAPGANPAAVMPAVLKACRKVEKDCEIDF